MELGPGVGHGLPRRASQHMATLSCGPRSLQMLVLRRLPNSSLSPRGARIRSGGGAAATCAARGTGRPSGPDRARATRVGGTSSTRGGARRTLRGGRTPGARRTLGACPSRGSRRTLRCSRTDWAGPTGGSRRTLRCAGTRRAWPARRSRWALRAGPTGGSRRAQRSGRAGVTPLNAGIGNSGCATQFARRTGGASSTDGSTAAGPRSS